MSKGSARRFEDSNKFSSGWDKIFKPKGLVEEKLSTNIVPINKILSNFDRWVYTGCSPHNGEYWYDCKICKKSDWIASYGTMNQLGCACNRA